MPWGNRKRDDVTLPLEMEQFLDYIKEQKSGARESIKTYRNWLIRHWKWRIANSHLEGYSSPLCCTHAMIMHFHRSLISDNLRSASIGNYFAVLKMYVDWLVYTGKITLDFEWPKIRGPKGKTKLQLLMIHPEFLFNVRQKRDIRVEAALLVEMLLSSGMRISEFLQLWLHEIDFADRPFDIALQRPSPYAGGSVTLSKDHHVLKSLPRKVYFSALTGKLLKRYMAKFGLTETSRVPLFPWSKRSIVGFLNDLSSNVNTTYTTKKIEPPPETPNKRILDPQASNRFKIFAERQKKRIKDMQSNLADRQLEIRSNMHPHAFRHAFTNYMFYRSYGGLYGSADSVRLMLGHASYHELTTYLTRFDMIPDDECWKRIMVGRPTTDWVSLV